MIKSLKNNKTSLPCIALFVLLAFMLSGCTSFFCLTGLCPSEKEVVAKIIWNPPFLDYKNCPDISGKYSATNHEVNGIDNELLGEFPQGDNELSSIHGVKTREIIRPLVEQARDFAIPSFQAVHGGEMVQGSLSNATVINLGVVSPP
jgi:hypothetical protein